MRRRLAAALLWLLFCGALGGQALASELPALPPELERAAPEAAALVSGDAADGFGLFSGVEALLREGLAEARTGLMAGVRAAAALMAGVLLLGAVESAAPAGRDLVGRCGAVTGALWITAVSAGDLRALIGLGRAAIVDIAQLSKVLLPTLAAAEAASGGITAASVRQVAAVFFADVLLTVIERVLLPMVYLLSLIHI